MQKTFLGIGSYSYPFACGSNKRIVPNKFVTALDLAKKAKAYNLRCIQVADNLPVHLLDDVELRNLKDYCTENGIRLEIGCRGLMPTQVKQYIDLAHRMGSPLIRCVIDAKDFQPDKGEIIRILDSVHEDLNRYDIILGIENHDRFYSYEFAEIIASMKDRHYGIVLDTANSLSKEESSEKILETLAVYTVCLHIKDYVIERRKGEMGLVIKGAKAGQGRLDIPRIITEVRSKAKQSFSTILESWMESLEDSELTIREEEKWVDEGICYLKTLIPD